MIDIHQVIKKLKVAVIVGDFEKPGYYIPEWNAIFINQELNEIERAAEQAVEDAVKYADESELPDVDSLHEDVFA